MRPITLFLTCLALCATSAPALARDTLPAAAVAPSDALQTRAGQVVDLFNGKLALEDFFIPGINADQFNGNIARIRERMGAAVGVSAIEAQTAHSAVITIDFERGQRRMRLGVSDTPPHLVSDFGPAR